MTALLDILVNISPVIILFNIFITFKNINKEETILENILLFLSGFLTILACNGYGIILVSIITITLTIIWILMLAFWCWIEFGKASVFHIIGFVIYAIIFLFLLYNRLKSEDNIEIKFAGKLQNLDVFEVLSFIIQNEWFKGIVIAASGSIISGLVLNKISRKN